jgi:mannose-6-phosphate isomerase
MRLLPFVVINEDQPKANIWLRHGKLTLAPKRAALKMGCFVGRATSANLSEETIVLVEITNNPRNYAWGSLTAIAELLGTPQTGEPQAELWLGAHPGSPSVLVDNGRPITDLFPAGLPFLLKVLAAASPLSLQAHPTLDQAREGFARENAAGILIDSSSRNYKDALHKPEAIVALVDGFQALCGFRSVEAARAALAPLIADEMTSPANTAVVAAFSERLASDASLPAVFEWLMAGEPEVSALVAALTEYAARGASQLGDDGEHWRVVELLADNYPGDAGIAISLMLNVVTLQAGEALFLPAGNIHSYLGGLGIEIMASSDNVLRGGLTPKHVDVAELLTVLDFEPLPIPYLVPEQPVDGVSVFDPGLSDFSLTVVTKSATISLPGPGIVLCTAGSFTLSGGSQGETAEISRGHSFLANNLDELAIRGEGQLFVATAGAGAGAGASEAWR